MSDKLPISVLIPARNEEPNIAACLDSVAWADEVVVVDSASTDRTAALAEAAGARVVQFRYNGGWPKKKNWALRQVPFRNEWILILDADERVDESLRAALAEAIRRPDMDGYYVRWKFVFLGRWMRHCWTHGWMLRLFRRGRGEYEDLGMRGEGGWDNEVHENLVVAGRTGFLAPLLVHETRQDLSYWIRKQNEFSDWNAVRRVRQRAEPAPPLDARVFRDPVVRRKFLKALYLRLPGKPVLMFLYLYLVKLGLLDGLAGLYFCGLRAMHELNISAKMYEHGLRARAGRAADEAPVVLALSRSYAPAFKAGGPARSLAGLASRLTGRFRFKAVTLDRDSGDSAAFAGVAADRWTARDGAEVLYLSPRACSGRALRRIVRATPHDVLYVNSLFDPVFTLAALWGRRLGGLPRRPVLLVPRGELQAGALAQKRAKKRAFLWLARRLGLYRGLHWHATCEGEKADILRVFGAEPRLSERIHVCQNMAAPADQATAPARDPKRAGQLRAVFVSRITPKKNLEGAIALLAQVQGAVTLDVIGPVSDPAYWSACQAAAARAGLAMNHRGALPHEEIVGVLAGYDAFVFPTLGENFGHVVLEALLAGCPTVVSDAAPWRGLEEARAGWVLPLTDETRWLAVLDRLAGMAEGDHAAWRAGARRLGAQVLADTRPAADHARMFESVLAEG